MTDTPKDMPLVKKPVTITWLPTRRCQLRCHYCVTRQDDYPEMDRDELVEIFETIPRALGDVFWCILGGDITMWPKEQLLWWIREAKKRNIFYAPISNSVAIDDQYAEELMDAGLSNWTISVDPRSDGARGMKGHVGMEAIETFKKYGEIDFHAMVTIDGRNFKYAPETVKFLNERGIWSEITPITIGHNEYYDYAAPRRAMGQYLFRREQMADLQKVVDELLKMKSQGYSIHNVDYYMTNWTKYVVNSDWICKHHMVLTFEPDGKLKPCIHIKGNRIRKWNVLDLDEDTNWDEIFEARELDKKEQCKGCMWNCPFDAEYLYSHLGSVEKMNEFYKHGVLDLQSEFEFGESKVKEC